MNNPAADVEAAFVYAKGHHVRTGIAVLDLKTGQFYSAGDATGLFGAASVMKVLIATRLLATGQMTDNTEKLATAMIERSDDAAANTLWPMAGGSEVVTWVGAHYQIDDLGTPNTKPGIWGNTHLSPKGLVYLYRAIAADPKVGPWLMNAMHHATRIAADGTNQYFGIPQATTGFAVKQGWGARSADDDDDAIVNTTGYVNGDRYAVAILSEGLGDNASTNDEGYNSSLAAIVSRQAVLLLPHGRIH